MSPSMEEAELGQGAQAPEVVKYPVAQAAQACPL